MVTEVIVEAQVHSVSRTRRVAKGGHGFEGWGGHLLQIVLTDNGPAGKLPRNFAGLDDFEAGRVNLQVGFGAEAYRRARFSPHRGHFSSGRNDHVMRLWGSQVKRHSGPR